MNEKAVFCKSNIQSRSDYKKSICKGFEIEKVSIVRYMAWHADIRKIKANKLVITDKSQKDKVVYVFLNVSGAKIARIEVSFD